MNPLETISKLVEKKRHALRDARNSIASVEEEVARKKMEVDRLQARLASERGLAEDVDSELQMLIGALQAMGVSASNEIDETDVDLVPQSTDDDRASTSESSHPIESIALSRDAGGLPRVVHLDRIDFTEGETRVHDLTVALRRELLKRLMVCKSAKTAELAQMLTDHGVQIGGSDVVSNLSAVLSRSSLFKSEKRRWRINEDELRRFVSWEDMK